MVKKFAILIFLYLFSTTAFAGDLEATRIEIEARKKVEVARLMDLSTQESEPFWDVYAEYEHEIGKITQQSFELIKKFNDGYNNNSISEQSANNMLATYFRLEGMKLQLKQEYYTRFQQVIPVKKVFRFFQIDNKIDSMLQCDIAKKVPLINADD